MGTPDTWLAQDGHYALPAWILKAARLSAPVFHFRWCSSFGKAPRGRQPWFEQPEKQQGAE